MGLSATIYPISLEEYEAAMRGDLGKVGRDGTPAVDLDKAWHAIHHLVTADSTLNFLLSGTQAPEVSDKDCHCELHAPKDIELLYRRLGKRSAEDIMSKFDPATFNQLEIYPDGWSIEARFYIQPYLEKFLNTLRQAVDGKLGFPIVIA